MKKKTIIISIILILILIAITLITIFIMKNKNEYENENEYEYEGIPDGYIAVFNDGVGEIKYSTYVYKIDNGHDNYGFKYINTTSMTVSWGSSEWITKINKKGKVNRMKDVLKVAKEHGAYSYVLYDNKTYSIEDFKKKLSIN